MSCRRKEASLTSREFASCFVLTIPVCGVGPLLRRGALRGAHPERSEGSHFSKTEILRRFAPQNDMEKSKMSTKPSCEDKVERIRELNQSEHSEKSGLVPPAI